MRQMKYIDFSADYTEYNLSSEFSEENFKSKIPRALQTKINDWNVRYNTIISLTKEERQERIETIRSLDKEGVSLATEIKNYLSKKSPVKISYFSEGLGHLLGPI